MDGWLWMAGFGWLALDGWLWMAGFGWLALDGWLWICVVGLLYIYLLSHLLTNKNIEIFIISKTYNSYTFWLNLYTFAH
jgi:hypothetical protein